MRVQPTFLTQEKPITWEAFFSARLPPETNFAGLAFHLADYGMKRIGFLGPRFDIDGLNPFTIGAAMMGALARCTAPVTAPPPKTLGGVEGRVGEFLMRNAKRIASPRLLAADRRTDEGQRTIRSIFLGHTSCTFAAQGNPMMAWARIRFLLGCSTVAPSADVAALADDLSCELLGCDLATAVAAATLVVAHVSRSPYVDLDAWMRDLADRPALAAAVRRYVEASSLPLGRVRTVVTDELAAHDDMTPRVLRFWQQFPLVHMGGPHYLPGPPQLVVGELGMGLLFRLLRVATARNGGDPRTPFSNLLGKRFEGYIERLLAEASDRAEVVPEHEFHRTADLRSSDVIAFDRNHNVVTLFEAKILRLSPSAFFGIDNEAFVKDLRVRLGAALAQPVRYLWRLALAREAGAIRPEVQAVSERILDTKNVVIAVVVPSLPFPIASRDFRRFVWEGAASELGKDTAPDGSGPLRWFEEFRKPHDVRWGVLDAEDVEYLVGWKTKRRLGRTLLQFFAEVSKEGTIGDGGLLLGLQAFTSERGADGHDRPKIVEELAHDLWNEAAMRAFGKPIEFETLQVESVTAPLPDEPNSAE